MTARTHTQRGASETKLIIHGERDGSGLSHRSAASAAVSVAPPAAGALHLGAQQRRGRVCRSGRRRGTASSRSSPGCASVARASVCAWFQSHARALIAERHAVAELLGADWPAGGCTAVRRRGDGCHGARSARIASPSPHTSARDCIPLSAAIRCGEHVATHTRAPPVTRRLQRSARASVDGPYAGATVCAWPEVRSFAWPSYDRIEIQALQLKYC